MNDTTESLWREPQAKDVTPQQQEVGYPRVVGHYPGTGMSGYVAGEDYMAGGAVPPGTMVPMGHPQHPATQRMLGAAPAGWPHMVPLPLPHPPPHHQHMHGHPIHSPEWRPMNAPGSPPLGEGHVALPLNPETFGGSWGNTTGGGAPAGTTIIFSSRPQKPFKTSRILIRGTKSGTTAVGNMIGQIFVGTDLQQGEVGNIDLESIGAANAFDTWVSLKQAEPGVWIRILATLSAFPTGTDFELYTCTAIGHYLH
jgi:hypothetical protein